MYGPLVLIHRNLSGMTLLNKGIFLPGLLNSLVEIKINCFSPTQSVFLPYVGLVQLQACIYLLSSPIICSA